MRSRLKASKSRCTHFNVNGLIRTPQLQRSKVNFFVHVRESIHEIGRVHLEPAHGQRRIVRCRFRKDDSGLEDHPLSPATISPSGRLQKGIVSSSAQTYFEQRGSNQDSRRCLRLRALARRSAPACTPWPGCAPRRARIGCARELTQYSRAAWKM
jgi:hypothetical protein